MTAGPGALVVVIADDDPDIRQLVTVAALRAQLTIGASVSDGAAALDAIRKLQPDMAILDVSMPVLSGVDVCLAVRADPAIAGTKLMLLSAAVQDSAVNAGLQAGADHYFPKPFSPRALKQQILDLLYSPVAR